MIRTYVVVSTLVDRYKDERPDMKIHMFRSMQELSLYIAETPIRAETLFITQEVFDTAINTSLNFLLSLFTPFFRVDNIKVLVSAESKDVISSTEYLINQNKLDSWELLRVPLTKEYINAIIDGTVRTEELTVTRRVIYRQSKSDYVKEKLNENLNKDYSIIDEDLNGIPTEEPANVIVTSANTECKIYTIAGLQRCKEVKVFSFIFAQYLSLTKKTVMIESDIEYLFVSEIAYKSKADSLKIEIEELYKDSKSVFRKIKVCKEKLIVFTNVSKFDYNYSFVCQLLYNNLYEEIDYMIIESVLDELSISEKYITVIPNNVVDIIETVLKLPENYKSNTKFVSIEIVSIDNISIRDSRAIELIVSDILNIETELQIPIYKIDTLELGGNYDLYMFTNI